MRKTIFLLSILSTFLLLSCAPKFPYRVNTYGVDFREHATQGFFITESNSVSFDYEPVGTVQLYFTSGYEVIKGKKESGRYTDQELQKLKYGDYVEATYAEALQMLVEDAKALGANGIINVKFHFQDGSYDIRGKPVFPPSKVSVSGMAIKK